MAETGISAPDAKQIFEWVCSIRRAKLPDPAVIGNAGSFFKNPVVTEDQCRDIIGRDPHIVHYPMPDGTVKLAAGWLIDACGWKGKSVGGAAVYEKQALVLVNKGEARGAEVVTLARAIPGKRLRALWHPAGAGAGGRLTLSRCARMAQRPSAATSPFRALCAASVLGCLALGRRGLPDELPQVFVRTGQVFRAQVHHVAAAISP